MLLIDDDPAVIESLRLLLELDGHEVLEAGGGDEGIGLFLSSIGRGEDFDAVITDFSMPNVGGEQVAQTVKSHRPSVPVLLMTGWSDRTKLNETSKLVDFILEKPVRLEQLRETLNQCAP